MARRADLVVAERERVWTALAKLFGDVPPTQANFVWLPLRDRAEAFAAACEAAGVDRAAVRRRRGARHHRYAGGERRLPRGRRVVPDPVAAGRAQAGLQAANLPGQTGTLIGG